MAQPHMQMAQPQVPSAQPIQFFTRYQKGVPKKTVIIDDDSDHPSYSMIYRLIEEFHTKTTYIDKIKHMTILFQELIRDPYAIQNNWKLNCSIKSKIEMMKAEVINFMEDKKRYRQIYSIMGGMHDKSDHLILKNALRETLHHRQSIDHALSELYATMNHLERLVDESEKSAFTLKLLKDQQIYIAQ